MKLNILFKIILLLLINFPYFVLSNNPVVRMLSNHLLDKSPVLSLAQLLMTAKLAKDIQEKNVELNDSEKTRYLFFVGKGNIQLQNHELEIVNSTESTDSETTTNSYNDLSKNKHLMKFVSRNGYEVWKRMLDLPQKANNSLSWSKKQIKNLKLDKIKVKPLYKPDVQLIENENGIIEHKVQTPQWFKNKINSGENKSKYSKKFIPIKQNKPKQSDFFEISDFEEDSSLKNKKKAKVMNRRKSTSKKTIPLYGFNSRLGRIVMDGFNGLCRGIGSLLGFSYNQENIII